MKNNLSKNTTKALAVGLAVGLGSSVVISGVNGNLVMVKAAAPVVSTNGIIYNDTDRKITIIFDQNLEVANNGNVTGFSITDEQYGVIPGVNIATREISTNEPNKIEMLLTGKLPEGTYKIIYDPTTTNNNGSDALQNSSGDKLDAFEEMFTVDKTAPTITKAEIEDTAKNIIKVTFSEEIEVEGNISNINNLFTIKKNSTPLTIDDIYSFAIDAGKSIINIKLRTDATHSDVYTIDYTGDSNNYIKDKSGNKLANFVDTSVTNNITELKQAPTVSSAIIEDGAKNIIKVTFDKEIQGNGIIDNLFTVNKGGSQVQGVTTAIDTNNSAVINITLPVEAKNGENYTVSYAKNGNNFIADKTDSSLEVANFTDEKVTNNIQNPVGGTIAKDDEITADGFKFKVLATTNEVALIEKITTRANHTGNSVQKGTLKVNVGGKEQTLTITQVGDGTNPVKGNFTVSDLNNVCAEVKTIEAKAFDGAVVTGGNSISFPAVTEVKANALAFASTSGVTKVELPAVKVATNINADAFKATSGNSSVKTVSVDKTIQNEVKKQLSNNSITVETVSSTTSTTTTTTKPNSGSNVGGAIINGTQTQTTVAEGSTEATTTQIVTKNLSLDKVKLPTIGDMLRGFTDIPANHWASEAIGRLASAEIIQGMPDGSFNANGKTKRADMTVMLVRLLGLNETFIENFNDINPNAYYANAVGIAREYGIVNGGTDGKFNPDSKISRQDTMVMISRILQNLGINVNTDTTILAQFSDYANISQYALEATAILVNAGIINGNNGNINPKASITRAEVAVIMDKLYNIVDESKKISVKNPTEATTETIDSTETTTK